MSLSLTKRAQLAVGAGLKQPNIVLEIDGIGTLYGAVIIKTDARIGDSNLELGDPVIDDNAFYIGGLEEIGDQNNAISLEGTTTQIAQTLQIDLGQGGSISNMQIALMDGDGAITKLITPGALIPDILQTKCKVYLGFSDVAWPEDYVVIFRGVVTDAMSDAGKIVITINHPDDKKQGSTFKQVQPKLVGAINNSVTTITVDSISDLLTPVLGPDGTYDPSYQSCVIIDNEVIKYTGIAGFTLTGCTRGHLFTTAAAHDDGTDITTLHHLTGNCVDLALKILASTGTGANYLSGLAVSTFGTVDGATVANAVYFTFIDVVAKYNIQVGDYVTITLATNGANNVVLRQIVDIVETSTGSYLVLGGSALVLENPTSAVCAFRSQYDTLPDGIALTNDEIDFDEHLRLQGLFLASNNYDFRLKDTVDDTRQFIEQEIYSPVACFSLPRKSRCSLGYHIGPIPGQDIKTFDYTNIKEPSKMKLQRTTNRNFYNEIIYQFDEDTIKSDQFNSGVITISELSKAQIKGTDKTLIIKSKGLRTLTTFSGGITGQSIATSQSNRRLNRYQYAAELLSFGVLFSDGFNCEIGDIIWVDGTNLQLPDIKTGKKGMAGRYFFVQNKKLNIKTGDIQLDCLDTHFAGTGRYGLISPSSLVSVGTSKTQFTIQPSFSKKHGTAEHKKWTNLVGATVRVRSADFSMLALTTLVDASSNVITVSPALPWTPSVGMILELPKYTEQVGLLSANLVYVSMSNVVFPDGKNQFVML